MGCDPGPPPLTGTHRPGILALLLLLGSAYATGWWRLSRRAPQLVGWWRPLLTFAGLGSVATRWRPEEHTSELQSRGRLVCRLLLETKKEMMPLTRLFRCP